jgi:hypothetical protein
LQDGVIKLCHHKSAGNVNPDEVSLTSGFGHDTTAVIVFNRVGNMPSPFANVGSKLEIEWNQTAHCTLRKDLVGHVIFNGHVDYKCSGCPPHKGAGKQGPVVDADD